MLKASDLDFTRLEDLLICGELNVPLGRFSKEKIISVFGNTPAILIEVNYLDESANIFYKIFINKNLSLQLKITSLDKYRGRLIKKYNLKNMQEIIDIIKETKLALL